MKAYYTPEDIIAAGERLEKETKRPPEPWEIFSALGTKGKFERVRDVWQMHVASRARGVETTDAEEELPEAVAAAIEATASEVDQRTRTLVMQLRRQLIQDHIDQLQLAQRTHSDEVSRLRAECAFWRERACQATQGGEHEVEAPEPPAGKASGRRPIRKTQKPKPKLADPRGKQRNPPIEGGDAPETPSDEGQGKLPI